MHAALFNRFGASAALTLLLAAATQAEASVCRAQPVSLPPGTPSPVAGTAYHYTQPTLQVAGNGRMLSVETWQSPSNDVFGSSRRVILWDSQSLQPVRLYYVPAAQRTEYAQRAVGEHAVALRGNYKRVAISADGQRVAFGFEGTAGEGECVDVYEDGTHIANLPARQMLGFFGNQLVLAKLKGSKVEELQLQSLTELKKPIRQWKPPKGMLEYSGTVRDVIGKGRYVMFDSKNVFDVQAWKLIAEHHCGFKCTTVTPTAEEKPDLLRAMLGNRNAEYHSPRYLVHEDKAAFQLADAIYIHDGPVLPASQLFARATDDGHVALQWKDPPDASAEDAIHYLRLYDIVTGKPIHDAPVQTPGWGSGYVMHERGNMVLLDDATVLFAPAHNVHEHSERIRLSDGERHLVSITSPPAESLAIAQRAYADWKEREREADARAASTSADSPQALFVEHIERYGPDTTDSSTFHYQVQLYCSYGGKQCQAMQVRARNFQDQQNSAAEQANMRRIWQTQGPGNGQSLEEFGRRSRERSACLQKLTESIERQSKGQQSWRYSGEC